jgi:phosphoglycerol transferase MdoB-like AlkP superfamily enzyme
LLTNNISGLRIYEQEDFKAKKIDVWGISDKNLFLEANRILAQQSKPFFSIIQTADNHRPYTIPAEDLDEFEKVTVPEDSLRKYGFDDNAQYNAFRYTDFCFKKFMDAASREKYYSNTIFIFVGDHGLRGDAGNMFPISFTRQGILAEHVPLLFYAPGLVKPARYGAVSSQLDILPSVAAITRQSHRNSSFGRNLFDSLDRTPRYSFIADPDLQTIGLVSDEFYYSRNLATNATSLVSVKNNDPVVPGPATDSLKTRMAGLTEAWYETARYLLFHNKKKN